MYIVFFYSICNSKLLGRTNAFLPALQVRVTPYFYEAFLSAITRVKYNILVRIVTSIQLTMLLARPPILNVPSVYSNFLSPTSENYAVLFVDNSMILNSISIFSTRTVHVWCSFSRDII